MQVVSKGRGAGGSFLLGLAVILVAVILTVGVIIAFALVNTSAATVPPDEGSDVEQVMPEPEPEDVTPDESYAAPPTVSVDMNSSDTSITETLVTDNPTRTFFESRGTLSDVSELGWLGERLGDEQKRVYLLLHSAISDGREDVTMTEIQDEHSIDAAWQALFADHPEFFWLTGKYFYTYDPTTRIQNVQFEVAVALFERSNYQKAIEARAIEFQNLLPDGASEYDIALKAYEYIVNHTEYDDASSHNQTILSVFANGRSVCAGYARAYQYLLQRAGMSCAYVQGEARTADGGSESHAWNLVRIDGQYTFVDPTWGDSNPRMITDTNPDWGGIRYAYFGMTTAELLRTGHTPADPGAWPQCDSTDFNVYRRSGMCFDSYSKEWFESLVQQKVLAGWTVMDFQFTNDEAFAAFSADTDRAAHDDDFEYMEDLTRWMDVRRAGWRVIRSDTTRTAKFMWYEE